MGYKVNPLSSEELRALAVQRLGRPVAQDRGALTAEQAGRLLEEVTIGKVEIEIQNEYLQEACYRLEVALSEATDLYNFAPVGCISTDAAGKISRLNLAGAKLLGQERHRLIGSDFASFFLPGQRPRIQALIRQASLSNDDLQHDMTLEGNRNTVKHVGLVLVPMGDGIGCQVVLHDITRHRALEDELRANEERWKFALDAAGDGVWDWDLRSDSVHYSPKLAQLYGCPPEQFGARIEAWHARVHPQDWAGLLGAMQKCMLGTQRQFCNAHRVRCEDGQWKWIACQGAVFERDAANKVARMIGTHSDISECKQQEQRLQELGSVQQALLESVPQYLALLDADGRVLQTNALWNAYGLARGHSYHNGFAGLAYADLLGAVMGAEASTRRAALAGIADVVSGNAPRFQMDYAFQDGTGHHSFSMTVTAVGEGPARAVVSHQDVSRFTS